MIEDADLDSLMVAAGKAPPAIEKRIWTAVAAFAIAALVAICGFVWRFWDDQSQIDGLQSSTACRSQLAADMDVKSAEFNVALGQVVVTVAAHDQQAIVDSIRQLDLAKQALESAASRRAQTNEICT